MAYMQGAKGFPRRIGGGLTLLYEDEDIIAVDKPAGLLSIAREGGREKSAYSLLAAYLRTRGGGRASPALVHRLDRDTSGIMIFAKNGRVKKKLMDNWNEMVKTRRYIAAAEGSLGGEEGLIDLPLGEDASGRVVAARDGKPARTRWKLIAAGKSYSLLSLELETGRRNQIRAHLAALGCPVAGDKKYWAKSDPLRRLCLHAEKIAFLHPRSGKLTEFESPAPEEFRRLIRGADTPPVGRH